MKKLFFALITSFLFVATAWGQCYSEYLQSTVLEISKRNTVAFETDFTNHPVKKVSFMAKRYATGIGDLYLEECINGSWKGIWQANPGVVTKTFIGIETEVDYANYEVAIDNKATAIRFKTDGVLSYKKYLKNVILEYVSDYTKIPSTSINFVNGAGTHTINIEYSSLTNPLTASLEKQDGVISLNSVNIANAGCSYYGTVPLTISYNPTNCKDYTNKIIFSNGTKIEINCTYERSFTIDTEDIKFPIVELDGNAQTIGRNVLYSYNLENVTATLENADTPFSLSTEVLAEACAKGSKTLTISFDPKEVGPYTNVIKLSNGSSISISGECSKKINTKLEVLKESYTSVSLNWTKVDGATAYRVIENSTGTSYIVDGILTSFNFRGLQTNTSYSFTLYALFDGVASLNSSNDVTAKTLQTDVPIQDCIVYENAGEKRLMASTDEEIIYDFKKDNSESLVYTKRVEFEARMRDATVLGVTYPATVSPGEDMMLYVKLEGKSEFEKFGWNAHNAGITESYKKFTVEIPYNTVAIRFFTGTFNGGCWREVKNLKVYKDRKLDAYLDEKLEKKAEELDFGIIEPNASVSKTLYVKYVHAVLASDVTYDNGMRVVVEDGLGHYKVEYDQKNPCAEGSQAVKVTFTPTNCTTDYNATLTLLNGETVEVKLKGTLKRNSGTVSEITWTGAVDTNWDNRANWEKADENVLSVADVLDEKLKVNIPAGLAQYPVIPDVSTDQKFKTDRDKACDCAQVNAGDNATATMIADKIYMANGAALVGVETLNAGTLRYNEVEIDFTPVRCYKDAKDSLRYDWTLVGPVVKPWNEDKLGETRNVVSGDYFLQDLPHVYMHKAGVQENPETGLLSAMWNESFPDLDVDLTHERAFAIRIPDQYGRNMDWWGMKFEKLPAEVYNSLFLKEGETPYDGEALHTYTFKGRFYNDASLPTYTLPNAGEYVVLNNSYPANIDAQKLKAGLGREIQYYDYINKGFVILGDDNKSIMSQSSFIIKAKANSEKIEIKRDWFETSKTDHKCASVDTESFRVELRNKAASSASEIYVCYDPLKEDELNYSVDATKIFNTMEASLPDLYSMRYNKKLSGLVTPTLSEPIPLGINVSLEDQTFTFSLKKSTLSADVILEDRLANTQYNLSEGEICEVEGLKTGLCEGRFYLLLAEQEVEDPEISTGIDDALIGDIDIYTNGNSVVVSSTSDIELAQVIVSDMAGRSQVYNVSDNYAQINLPVETGVYTINVIGDKSSRVEKIKIN